MLLTQADAMETYCPYHVVNITCDASDCMMWRWYEPPKTEADKLWQNDDRRGYCGLAGKPEYA